MESEEEEELASLRAFGIVKESFKLLFRYFRFFLPVLFTLGVPYLLLFTLQELAFPNYPSAIFPPPNKPAGLPDGPARAPTPAGSGGGYSRIHGFLERWTILGRDFSVSYDLMFPVLRALVAVTIRGVIEQVVRALWVAGTIYTVGLVYIKNYISFKEVMRAVPRVWTRLMVTWLYMVYILAIGYAVFGTILGVIVLFNLGYDWTVFLGVLPFGILSVCSIAIGIVAEVAEGVTIFEDSQGSAAFGRSMELLEDKRRVAVGVFSLWRLLLYLLSRFLGGGVAQSSTDDKQNLWNARRILSVIFYSFTYWMLNQVYQISRGVLYVSFKVFHGESISDPRHFQTLTEADMDGDAYHSLEANSGCMEPEDTGQRTINSISSTTTRPTGNCS